MLKGAMKIAVEGCCHGDLRKIYQELARLEAVEQTKVDLLIICGDFQAVRNQTDLASLACPPKYRKMGDFHLYYEGKERAPVPTIFIGGNHEASNHLFELYHGGWVCPNIYFLGYSGVVRFGGLRIGGLSGIHNERIPFDHSTMRSIYHYRQFETWKLAQVQEPLDIFVSHEWPTGIYHYGDTERLLSIKPYFKQEVNSNTLGAKPLEDLLFKLKPSKWFAAHMHVHFEAQVPHPAGPGEKSTVTEFMALDKCLPRRKFLKIVDVETPSDIPGPFKLEYDPEWLGIVRASDRFMSLERRAVLLPDSLATESLVLADMAIPSTFQPSVGRRSNPQTDRFCGLLGIENPHLRRGKGMSGLDPTVASAPNPDEIPLDL
jgi:lariat debranching enzyme